MPETNTDTHTSPDATAEVQKNFAAFQKLLPEKMKLHAGKFALMSDGALIDIYDTWQDAYRTGHRFFGADRFSIQQFETRPADLGFWSHAII
ncbi:MAG: hypothetical protein GDA52_05215 [Rhodobacteraceae bacterium]|nr:hypothetical protein [Paracoccaceae bacterium]